MIRGNVIAVVGANYGSEGKGNIVSEIAAEYDIHVRTGGPNAGHSHIVKFHNEHGIYKEEMFKQQVVPVGWANNPNAKLVIGKGALVDLNQLRKEVNEITSIDPSITNRLVIDQGAGVLDLKFKIEEGGIEGDICDRIGSTGEGVGAARVARVNRDSSKFRLMNELHRGECGGEGWDVVDMLVDTVTMINTRLNEGYDILLEGTQGSGLSLIHGPWPFVTSHDTNAAQLAADAGIPPHHVTQVLLVARTMPIRVAGNSGPLYGEMSWEDVSTIMGRPIVERTTTTKRERRIGSWDERSIAKAVILNAPTSIAINFMDYMFPTIEGKDSWDEASEQVKSFIYYVENAFKTRVSMVGTGGKSKNVIRLHEDL